jgi:hypothetical protein
VNTSRRRLRNRDAACGHAASRRRGSPRFSPTRSSRFTSWRAVQQQRSMEV